MAQRVKHFSTPMTEKFPKPKTTKSAAFCAEISIYEADFSSRNQYFPVEKKHVNKINGHILPLFIMLEIPFEK